LDVYTVIRLAAIGLLLVCSAAFSGSETALFSLSRLQLLALKEERHPKCKSIRGLLDRPRRLLISLIMGNEFSNVVASTIATSTAVTAYGEGGKWLAFLIMTASVLLFGDLIPRSIALANPVRFSALVSEPLGLFVRAVTPLRKLVRIITDGILRIIPADTTAGQPFFMESDFLQLVEKGHEEGVVEEMERDLIRRVMAFGDTGVNEIMTPRMDMFTVPIDIGVGDLVESIKTHHFSRIPVYDAEPDNIVGIFHAKDILTIDPSEEAWNKKRFTSLLRSPCFVPVSKKVDVLFKEFQTKRIHVAIVVDEYGGISGLVTMEDLLEELFGEIYDEFDKTEVKYKRLDGSSLLISPRLSIEEFNALMNSDIPSDELATMGGFVFSLFGRIPSEREKTYYQNLLFIPTKVRGTRILEIRVERMGSTR
jgi:putative hemolysin